MNEDDRYRTSSQYRYWSYTPASLAALRATTNQLAAERVRAAVARVRASRAASASASGETSEVDQFGTPGSNAAVIPEGEVDCLTPEEELKLVKFYCRQTIQLGDHLNLPSTVKATALQYLKRFYLTNSTMTYSPPAILKTCLFFATKTEHVRFSVAKFAEAIGKTTPEDVLASEFLLTQGLRFTFDVRHPFRALKGAIMELRTLAEGNTPVFPGANSEVSRPPLTLEDPKYHIDGLDRKAGEILMTSALLTDVYFHYTPSQIMLAALLSVDEELTTWYMNAKLSFSPQLLEKVMQTLRSCAAMLAGVQPASQPSEAEMKELKALAKKLNKCRNPEKMDLVAMNRRAKRDPEDEDDRAAKKRRLEREKVEKEADELFGPRLLKNNGQHA